MKKTMWKKVSMGCAAFFLAAVLFLPVMGTAQAQTPTCHFTPPNIAIDKAYISPKNGGFSNDISYMGGAIITNSSSKGNFALNKWVDIDLKNVGMYNQIGVAAAVIKSNGNGNIAVNKGDIFALNKGLCWGGGYNNSISISAATVTAGSSNVAINKSDVFTLNKGYNNGISVIAGEVAVGNHNIAVSDANIWAINKGAGNTISINSAIIVPALNPAK